MSVNFPFLIRAVIDKDITTEDRNRAVKALVKYRDERILNQDAQNINAAFSWDTSEEGEDFWHNIYIKRWLR